MRCFANGTNQSLVIVCTQARPHENQNENQKNERGGRGRKETLPYLSSPTPPGSFTHAIFLIPSPSLRNRTETLGAMGMLRIDWAIG